MSFFIKNKAEQLPQSAATHPEKPSGLISADLAVKVSTFSIALLPALLGFAFIQLGIIYTGGLRPIVFEISWITLAVLVIAASIVSGAPITNEAKLLPRAYLTVFLLFASIWVYTAIFVAPSSKMANYFLGIGITAVLLGLTMAALKRRVGNSFSTKIAMAFFVAMLLHAPFWVWLYLLESHNSDFDWLYQLPGYPGLRMYGYSVEAGIATGLGLYFLSDHQSKKRRICLAMGVAFLWMLLFWGGGRGAASALFATIILVSLVIPKFAKTMWLFNISTITLGAGWSFLLPIPSSSYGIMGRLRTSFNSDSFNEISSNRFNIWSDAFEIFLTRPFFGHGPAQYRHLTAHPDLTVHEHTHNILLESLISFGALGTIALIFLLGKIWLTGLLNLRNTHSASTLPMFLVATTLLAHGFVSGTFYHINSMFMIAFALGTLMQITSIEQSPNKHFD